MRGIKESRKNSISNIHLGEDFHILPEIKNPWRGKLSNLS